MKKKTGIIVGGVVVALLAIVGIVLAIVFGMKGKGYRSIKVYKVNGTVTLDRTGTGSMDAYENLLLQAEDVPFDGRGQVCFGGRGYPADH